MGTFIFNGASVRAILGGGKTQTRRAVRFPEDTEYDGHNPETCVVVCSGPAEPTGTHKVKPHPVGSLMWVREAHGWCAHCGSLVYRSDMRKLGTCDNGDCDVRKWKSPIYLPRHSSRITLEITSLRVERVQDITDKNALAEGVRFVGARCDYRGAFAAAWDSINADRAPWESNPWVFAYTFKRITETP